MPNLCGGLLTIERAYAPLLGSQQWEPYTYTQRFGVFASKWPGESQTLWTIVNRNHYVVAGRQMLVPYQEKARYFDLWHGVELHPQQEGSSQCFHLKLKMTATARFLKLRASDAKLDKLLATMQALSQHPLDSFSVNGTPCRSKLSRSPPTKPADAAPAGMIKIPAASFVFRVNGIEIEGSNDEGVDFQYPWEARLAAFTSRKSR